MTTSRTKSDAILSGDGVYRYWLMRELGTTTGHGTCLFIMLNPSTADASIDDPTIRRCQIFARDWGYDVLEVVNLFAFRATSPADMKRAANPVGPLNDDHILQAARRADLAVAAWGQHGTFKGRSGELRQLLINERIPLHALKRGKDDQPSHPLYLPASLEPVRMD